MAKNWYVVHTQTGQEDRVKASLETKVKQEMLSDSLGQIIVPKETISEVRGGKKKISERKFFPGYIFIEMELNEKTWYLLKTTPGILGFLGVGPQPVALQQAEIETILKKSEERREKPVPKVVFEIGESVRIKEGPFMDFNGTVEEILSDRGKIKVNVSIFGRATPVELEFWQIEKI